MLTLFSVRFAWGGAVIVRVAAREENEARETVAAWLQISAATLIATSSRAR